MKKFTVKKVDETRQELFFGNRRIAIMDLEQNTIQIFKIGKCLKTHGIDITNPIYDSDISITCRIGELNKQ